MCSHNENVNFFSTVMIMHRELFMFECSLCYNFKLILIINLSTLFSQARLSEFQAVSTQMSLNQYMRCLVKERLMYWTSKLASEAMRTVMVLTAYMWIVMSSMFPTCATESLVLHVQLNHMSYMCNWITCRTCAIESHSLHVKWQVHWWKHRQSRKASFEYVHCLPSSNNYIIRLDLIIAVLIGEAWSPKIHFMKDINRRP